jgi:hypothetical protein
MMEIAWDWVALCALLLILIYTMIVVREEKNSYKESAVPIRLGPIEFPAPSWWGKIEHNDRELVFERTDTRYDWRAHLYWLPESWDALKETDLELLFVDILKKKQLEFDEINAAIQTKEYFATHPLVQNGSWEICRIEGTASKAIVDRVYYDAYLIRDHALKRHLYCESQSSVLNGLVEGPYFEEMMMNVKKVKETAEV